MWVVVIACFCFSNFLHAECFNLTILHTNDFHSRYEEISKTGGKCFPTKDCYGGIARQVYAVRHIRNQEENVIFLNAGDYYQGTVWYIVHRWKAVVEFTNRLHHDALALGNHEFDDGIEGLIPFLNNTNFPIISSNINTTGEPAIDGKIRKSVKLNVANVTVGVIGYTTKDTPELASAGSLVFLDEVESIREEAEKLKAEGVKIIIALGHAGFKTDLEIAKRIPAVDIVVGGHTNTFLYTGDPPSNDVPVGPYPFVVERDNGSKALVVQDYAFGKYLGRLKVTFNDEGNVESWSGNPILLNRSIPEDNETLQAVAEYKEIVDGRGDVIVGHTKVYLKADRPYCRLNECNLGNVITDAVLSYYLKKPAESQWNTVAIAVFNSGGIRDSIDENENRGDILMRDVMNVLPYRNTLDIVDLEGQYLFDIMEKSVSKYDDDPSDPPGRFLQVSGVKVTYNMSQPVGQRVHELLVHCTRCRVPQYLPVNITEVYSVVMPTYLRSGGDDYKMVPEKMLRMVNSGALDVDIVVQYLNKTRPIVTGIEGRITFLDPSTPCNSAVPSTISGAFSINLMLAASLFVLPNICIHAGLDISY